MVRLAPQLIPDALFWLMKDDETVWNGRDDGELLFGEVLLELLELVPG